MTSTIERPPAAPAAGRPARPSRPKRDRTSKTENLAGLAMLTPAVLLLALFIFVPAILAFGLAFTNARLISPYPATFVGLDNFVRLFADAAFFRALINVGYFALVVVPLQAGLALVMAILVNKKVRGTTFFRTVYFLPVVTSMVVVSLLWLFMYRQDGLINVIIDRVTMGLVTGPDWLNDTATSMPAIILMSVWQGVGFHMIIWLSGLQTIPADLYEAADLDGVSPWQRFRYITWPGLSATRSLILVTITIQALSLFTQISVMTQGGPLNSTTTVVYEAVESGFAQQETGYASAISLVFFVIVLLISVVQRFLSREKA
ncbi:MULTISPECIES: carbohydrate ABC transporter permease [unclassified Cryobacterium]|uniref:carbohydrate ABC transporter permease n=1 Tax=unclassified Cryobacterium TaxID=2649013 RepID=UPI001069F7E9|nr:MULTISPECIES: sugar ABC transporter permease [unclassified Cryobacterium]TFC54700.1 sugar ABC transporter permease [Cryobacterium sp. TMB3-1-2]TFC71526.1 sugar ABC transporter permease [Cryobacterium sp. TMB3-15]TFC72337.1 sugar ABC transporter permease [Cryobacterium sp. TMB3-10]TFD42513.1 sugar ABC transporter permease [Cryobacterium sp. TMB3-12]